MARKSRKNAEAAPVQAAQKPMFYAGAYIRLSVVDRKNKGESLENQQAIIEAFASSRDDIEIAEIYTDNGFSGQSFERPAFLRMIADMESGKINCCITKDLSRLGRNAIDSGYYLEKHFPSLGVRYIAVTDGYDSADGQSGGIIVSLKNMINEAYALDVSRKIKATYQMYIRNGKFVGSSAPYGYFKSGEDCHQLVVDEHAATVVRLMFEMAAAGEKDGAILAWLNDNKIMPPKRYFRSIGLATDKVVGALTEWWNISTVRAMLRDRVYVGFLTQGITKKVGSRRVYTPESEWIVTENAHEAIVSREMFETVQGCRGKKELGSRSFKTPSTDNIFARKLYCARCGYALSRYRSSEKSYWYVCGTDIRYSKDACSGLRIAEDALKKAVLGIIKGREPLLAQALSQVAAPAHADGNQKSELSAAQTEIDRNRRYLEGLYESLVSGDITNAEYRDMKSAYEAKIAALAERAGSLRDEIKNREREEAALTHAHESVQRIGRVSDLTAETVDRLVDRIVVCPSGRVGVKFMFLDEIVYSEEGCPDYE